MSWRKLEDWVRLPRAARSPRFLNPADRKLRGFLAQNHAVVGAYFVDQQGRLVTAAPAGIESLLTPGFRQAIAERCLEFRGNRAGFSEYYAYPDDPTLAHRERSLVLSVPVFGPRQVAWSGALCLVLPWRAVTRAAAASINPQPVLSDLRLDGQSLLRSPAPVPAGEPGGREPLQATASLDSRRFGIEPGRLTVSVSETRLLWLAEFYNSLASLLLIGITMVSLVGWMALRFFDRALAEERDPGRGQCFFLGDGRGIGRLLDAQLID